MRRRGFSLIELIVVTGLLVSSILFFLAMILGSRNASRESTERTQARAAAMARIGELRAMLRDQDPVANHDVQFQSVLDEDSGSGAATLPGTVTLVQELTGARIQGTITVTCYTDEATANAQLGGNLQLLNVDINGDGDTTDNVVALANMQLIPVRVEVQWLGSNAKGATDVSRVTLAALIY